MLGEKSRLFVFFEGFCVYCGFIVAGSTLAGCSTVTVHVKVLSAGIVLWLICRTDCYPTPTTQLQIGAPSAPRCAPPHGASFIFQLSPGYIVVVYAHMRVCKCLCDSLYTCTRTRACNFAMVTSVFTSCGPFKKSLFTCATLLLSFWRKYHESHTSCSSPLTQIGWRGTFFMKYDCERVIGWTY